MTWSIDAIANDKDNIMIRKASITSKGMSYIKRIDMVSDWLKQIWYRLWKEQKKVILQAFISLAVDCILSLKKIITYILLHLLNTGLDQLDEWYSWCGL
jgi:hypothetical protein